MDVDLEQINQRLRFPNDGGFLFNHVWGKTLRDGDMNLFGIRRNAQAAMCPIKGVEFYLHTARQLGIDLTCGYLFRPITPNLGVQDSPPQPRKHG